MTSVRVCTAADLELAVGAAPGRADADHLRERFGRQSAGEALLLLAWRQQRPVGRATLLLASTYEQVRSAHPRLAEINALEADPQGEGTGTALIEAALAICTARGIPALGLAVDPGNRALRLYRRLGFEGWSGGSVVDVWTEHRDDGTVLEHADPCDYLLRAVP